MDFTWREILAAVLASGGFIGGVFAIVKFFAERIDKRKTDKLTFADKASAAIWQLYEAEHKKCEELEKKCEELEKGDSLARPAVNKIYQAVRKFARQLEIVDAMLIKDFTDSDLSECLKVIDAVKRELELLWQKFDDLEKTLPE